MEETRICSSFAHKSSGSKYEKNNVPINLFEKQNSDIMYKTCEDCRNYDKIKCSDYKKNHKEKHALSLQNGGDFMYCPGKPHISVSKHDRDKVPKQLFKQFPDHENSPLLENCEDCRKTLTNKKIIYKNNREDESNRKGLVRCSQCKEEINPEELALNQNGETSTCCEPCKIKSNERNQYLQSLSQTIKLEMINNYEY